MASKLPIAVGQTFGNYNILAAAEPKSGHARWSVVCNLCGKESILRATALANSARCTCARSWPNAAGVSAPTAITPVDGPTNEDVLRAIRDLTGEVRDLFTTCQLQLQEIQALRDEMKQLRGATVPIVPAGSTLTPIEALQGGTIDVAYSQPATIDNPAIAHSEPEKPPKPAGLRDFSMSAAAAARPVKVAAPPRERTVTSESVRKEFPGLAYRERCQASMARALELAQRERTPEESDELADRLNFETMELGIDTNNESRAPRLALFNRVKALQAGLPDPAETAE